MKMPSPMNLHIEWVGTFRVGIGERKNLKLEFNSPTQEKAVEMIRLYVRTRVDKSWELVEESMEVTYNN